jgi:hypothetical protein
MSCQRHAVSMRMARYCKYINTCPFLSPVSLNGDTSLLRVAFPMSLNELKCAALAEGTSKNLKNSSKFQIFDVPSAKAASELLH